MSLTFDVDWVFETIGAQYGVNVFGDGIDDVCFGCVFGTDSTLGQFLIQHKGIYNYQIVDSVDAIGAPVTYLKRRAVNSDLIIDLEINEQDCIIRDPSAPAMKFTRIDPLGLYRTVEVQYSDPDRGYAINTQIATHHAVSRQHGKLTVPTSFIISKDQARSLAFDLLYRLWAQRPALEFEHPNPNIQAGDAITVIGRQGTFDIIVQEQTITKERTSLIKATALLTSKGIIIAAGSVSELGSQGIGRARGVAVVTGVGGVGAASFAIGAAAGVATVTGVGAVGFAVGTAAGAATVSGVGDVAGVTVGAAAGAATVSGVGDASTTDDDELLLVLL